MANSLIRNLKWFDTGRHEFLQVPKEDLLTLNIWADMTSFSYEDEEFAYLEEDHDAGIYVVSAKNLGWELSFEHHYEEELPILENESIVLCQLSEIGEVTKLPYNLTE